MFTLGGTELLIVGILVLLLFGPDKVPQVARTIGRAMREFNKYKDIMESAFRVEMEAAEKAGSPEPDDSMERLERSAAASREYAAEQAAAAEASGEGGGAVTADEPAPAEASCGPLTVTDEDEEEG